MEGFCVPPGEQHAMFSHLDYRIEKMVVGEGTWNLEVGSDMVCMSNGRTMEPFPGACRIRGSLPKKLSTT